jgi:hypothetical protein
MRTEPQTLARRFLFLVACLCLGTAGGCGPGFKVVPVAGKITINGKPLPDAEVTVLFRPDAAKGNTINLDFAGTADEDGNYTLYYGNGNSGAAPGWYKVAIVATEPMVPRKGPPMSPSERRKRVGSPIRKSLIDAKYASADGSGIEVQVVEKPAPGAYDFDLSGPGK